MRNSSTSPMGLTSKRYDIQECLYFQKCLYVKECIYIFIRPKGKCLACQVCQCSLSIHSTDYLWTHDGPPVTKAWSPDAQGVGTRCPRRGQWLPKAWAIIAQILGMDLGNISISDKLHTYPHALCNIRWAALLHSVKFAWTLCRGAARLCLLQTGKAALG